MSKTLGRKQRPPLRIENREPTAAESPARRNLAPAVLILLVVTAAVFINSFWGEFVFDDVRSILENWNIRDLGKPALVLSAKPLTRAVVNVSLAINYAISKYDPWSYHLLNLLVHLLAALTLLGIVRRTLLSERLKERFAQAATPLALAVALLWAVHPLQTQSVTYVIQRAESMMGLFYLLTLYAAIRGFASAKAWRWYAASFLACAAGMATKQVMVTAPIMVLLYDSVFVSGSPLKALRRHGLLYLPLAASWGILAALQGQATPNQTAGWNTGILWWEYALTQFEAITHYLRLTFWPDALCLEYGCTIRSHLREVWPQAILVLGLLVATGIALWRRPAWGFLGAWFFLILAPTSSIMPLIDPIFEHRMYLSLAVPVALVVLGFYRLAKAQAGRQWVVAAVCTVALVVLVAALGWRTFDRNRDYYDHETIWRDVLAKHPQSQRAQAAMGVFLSRDGKHEEAIAYFKKAFQMNPLDSKSLFNMAGALEKLGREDEAIQQLRKSIEIRPDAAPPQAKLGLMLASRRQYEEALPHFQEAVRLQPLHPGYLFNLARGMMEMGRTGQAIETFKEVLRLDPEYAQAHYHLGNLHAEQGDLRAAVEQLSLAIHHQQDFAQAHVSLGRALAELGEDRQAWEHLNDALEIEPQHSEAHYRLGALLAGQGRLAEALEHFRQVRPENGEAGGLAMLGQFLAKRGNYAAGVKYYRQALDIDPDNPMALNELAWLRATCPQEAFRDAAEAVALAERACDLTEYKDANLLDTLAAAYAEAGRFDQAVATAREAIRLAEADDQAKLPEVFREHLELYRRGQPFRGPSPAASQPATSPEQ